MIDTNWRTSFYDQITERELEDSMKTKDHIENLFEAEFNDFSQQLKHLTNVYDKDDLRYYKVYDRAIAAEFKNDIIRFYRIPFSSKGVEVKKELIMELTHNGEVFVQIIGNGQPDKFVNKNLIEEVLKSGFEFGQAVRY